MLLLYQNMSKLWFLNNVVFKFLNENKKYLKRNSGWKVKFLKNFLIKIGGDILKKFWHCIGNEKATVSHTALCDAIREKGPTIQKWKFTRRTIKETAAALNAFKDFFSIIHI